MRTLYLNASLALTRNGLVELFGRLAQLMHLGYVSCKGVNRDKASARV